MMPGPDQIIACPSCQGLARYMTLLSGNTFGAVVWTDGKQVAPMFPQLPMIVKCRHCAECYWLAQAKEVGTLGQGGGEGTQGDPSWASAEAIQEPTGGEYYRALLRGLATNSEQERNLRVLAWWRRNDAFRHVSARVERIPGPSRQNMEALSALLEDSDEDDRLMKAEVLRELGEFESATRMLNRVGSPELADAVCRLRSLCETRDMCVRVL